MSEDLTVTVADLRAAVDLLLNEAEARFGRSIELDADYYWDLEPSVVYDLTRVPTAPVACQLSDDVASVRGLLERESGGDVVLWHDLAHLVGILRRVALLDRPAAS